jgi:hypothetical protein
MINLNDADSRLKLIGSINSENNEARKQVNLKQFEVQGGRIQQFVLESLKGQLNPDSVREMPVVSSINVQSAVVNKKATIYKKKPNREFTETDDEQSETLELIYNDMKADMRLNKSNKNFVYQDQSIGMIIPKNGKLIMRIFSMHQIDAIVDMEDPESSDGFIISAFDRTNYMQLDSELKQRNVPTGDIGRSNRSAANSNQNEEVAEKYQFQKYVEKYIVWSKQYNFMMNGLGEIIDPETGETSTEVDISSPLASENIMPFFEIARDKDFEYFVRSSNALTDFTIQFNERLSDLAMTQKMDGFAMGILKTPSDLKPVDMQIGHSLMIHLPTDDEGKEVDFQFVSPNSNIAESSDATDRLLNYFITSEGLGGDVVNSKGETQEATSGIDRFLQSIQKIEAHVDDYELYRCAEQDIYKIIKAWLRVLNNSDALDKKYKVPTLNPESEIHVEYYKPEMMQTHSEKIANIEKLMDLELMSRKEAIMELRELSDNDKAQEILDDINSDNKISAPTVEQVPAIEEEE